MSTKDVALIGLMLAVGGVILWQTLPALVLQVMPEGPAGSAGSGIGQFTGQSIWGAPGRLRNGMDAIYPGASSGWL